VPWANIVRAGQFQLAGALGYVTGGLGAGGELARSVADHFKIRQAAFLAEFSLAPYYEAIRIARAAIAQVEASPDAK
jgi:hypothetical protein